MDHPVRARETGDTSFWEVGSGFGQAILGSEPGEGNPARRGPNASSPHGE